MIGKSLGHYEIQGSIGSGGMGQVYRARDKKLGRDVAIKMLPSSLRGNQKALARFEREAKVLAALNHPNIVTIYSIEEEQDDLFFTMELVEGQSLECLIRDDGMKVDEFVKIAVPLAKALAAAHAHDVIHRDLKPSNIFISHIGGLKVLDFGVARVTNEQPLTEANIAVGTPAYMSPEQISGGQVDGRSDIFSLGIIFYELLSGARPFRGDHPAAIMYSIVNEEAPRLTSIPEAVVDVVGRCLKRIPQERFAGADKLQLALQELTKPAPLAKVDPGKLSPEIRAAVDRGDWDGAYRALHFSREQRDLSPEELEVLAECANWLCKLDESIQIREKAYAIYTKSGQKIPAARVALDLVYNHLNKSAGAVASGWQKRAERFLQGEPECVERGHLLRRQAMVALGQCEFARAIELNQQCGELADRFSDLDLQAIALHDRGHILVARGDVEEGMALVDEAMASAVSGEVSPWTLGVLYCRTLSVCESLADYGRAREWSEAALRWCEPYAASVFPGVCRVHRADIMRHQGLWAEAEQNARSAYNDFKEHGDNLNAGEALIQLGELALHKGDYQKAEDAFRQAHELGCDPVPGLPLLRLAQGKGQAALQTIQRALSESPDDRLHRAKLLTASITIALANSQLSIAEAAVDELTEISKEFGCPTFKADALMARGAMDLERGNNNTATPALREAWSIFNELGFPYDAARARTLMAEAYLRAGDKEDAKLQLEAACKIFGELGAKPDLQSASELLRKAN